MNANDNRCCSLDFVKIVQDSNLVLWFREAEAEARSAFNQWITGEKKNRGLGAPPPTFNECWTNYLMTGGFGRFIRWLHEAETEVNSPLNVWGTALALGRGWGAPPPTWGQCLRHYILSGGFLRFRSRKMQQLLARAT